MIAIQQYRVDLADERVVEVIGSLHEGEGLATFLNTLNISCVPVSSLQFFLQVYKLIPNCSYCVFSVGNLFISLIGLIYVHTCADVS